MINKKILVALEKRMLETTDALAAEESRTRSDYIREAIRERNERIIVKRAELNALLNKETPING